MAICRSMHISHLKDGKLEVVFRLEPRPRPSVDELSLRMRERADLAEEG